MIAIRHTVSTLLGLAACGPKLPATSASGEASSTTGTSSSSSHDPEPTTSGSTAAEPSSTSSSTGEQCNFVGCKLDAGCVEPGGEECEVWSQNCPEGQKCVPIADCDGGWWIAERCIPIMENPGQQGEDCFSLGGGVDNCDKDLYCWHAFDDGLGYCIPLCKGSGESATCDDPALVCGIDSGDSTLGWCFAPCDPLIDSCPRSDEKCSYPSIALSEFVCWPIIPDERGEIGTLHDSCDYTEMCAKGLVCLPPEAAAECDPNGGGCCEPYCDLTHPDPATQCPGVGQKCLPAFEPDDAPPGDDDVGVCHLPI